MRVPRGAVLASILLAGVWAGPRRAGAEVLVAHDRVWQYHVGTNAPQSGWTTLDDAALDGSWSSGDGGFGFGNDAGETNRCGTIPAGMANRATTLFVRQPFTVTNAPDPALRLYLRMDWDDGYIAWLDGQYLASANVNGAPAVPGHLATATASHESSLGNATRQPEETIDLGPASAWGLNAGTHTLALVGLNQSSNSTDFILVANLELALPPAPVTTVWAVADSPIVLATNVVVPFNATLIIEPGVEVRFGAGISLSTAIGGCLLAEGTAEAPILFTRAAASGAWGNLTIRGDAASPESRIRYAQFAYNANNTGTPCIQVTGAAVVLDHLTFQNNAAPYMHLDGASFVVSHCEFPRPSLAFEPVHGADGIRSGGRGLFLRNVFGAPNGYNDVVDFTGGNRPAQPIVQFIDNVFLGSADDILDLDGTDAWIEGNIFLHVHRNGSPDSASAISGGSSGASTSELTVIGNLFFDCDYAALAKEGNFYVFLHNTIVHQSRTGGEETNAAVFVLAEADTTEGRGMFVEANVIQDAEALARNITSATVTFTNNLLPLPWTSAGGGNIVGDALFAHVPTVAETTNFASWADAQVMREWLRLQPGSPAVGAGPLGRDLGGVGPLGATVGGEPPARTALSNATIVVGHNRSGFGIPAAGFPLGAGYTHYRYQLDGGPWSAEFDLATPLLLADLPHGPHVVEVSGRRDSGAYQDDPMYGPAAATSTSRTWIVTDDVDDDGMPDDWETASFTAAGTNTAPGADPDGDGMSTWAEYIAGTDPTSTVDYLRCEVATSNEQVIVGYGTRPAIGPGYAGRTRRYRLQRAMPQPGDAWADIAAHTNVVGDGAPQRYTNTAAGPQFFFRVGATLE